MNNSIIVYRNPLEQMLWEGVLFMFVPILSGAITFFVLMYLGVFVLDRIGVTAYSRQFATSSKILLVVSGAIASGVVAFLLH